MNPAHQASLQVLERLEESGYEAYWVGGCVRDELLGKEPADYDVATAAHPETVQSLFPKTAATGLQHGTVTVLLKGQAVEVTTFRKETGYEDHRRPGQVWFVDELESDLARRDFTINAMARDRQGRLLDPFGGKEDLKAGVVRAVGRAEDRFEEDALRMLRALRFSAQLGFRLDKQTKEALIRQKPLLSHLAVERVTQELEKMWTTQDPSKGIQPLWEWDLFSCLPPFSTWDPAVGSPSLPVERMDRSMTRWSRWVFFLHLCGVTGEKSEQRLKSFRLSAKDVREIHRVFQIVLHWELTPVHEKAGKRLLLSEGMEKVKAALETVSVIRGLEKSTEEQMREALERWQREMPVHRPGDLHVDGKILSEAVGRKPGPWTGRVLKILLEKVAQGEIPNEKGALLKEGCRLVQPDS